MYIFLHIHLSDVFDHSFLISENFSTSTLRYRDYIIYLFPRFFIYLLIIGPLRISDAF